MIVSPFTKHFYIGKTNRNVMDRGKEHINNTLNKHDIKVYGMMRKIGIHKFLFIPITTTDENNLLDLEKLLIDRFQPSLNSKLKNIYKQHDYRYIKKSCRQGLKNRFKTRRIYLKNMCDMNREFKIDNLKVSKVIIDDKIDYNNFSFVNILENYENEKIKIIIDKDSFTLNSNNRICDVYGNSEILYYEMTIGGVKYYYDGKTCGTLMDRDDYYDLRDCKIRKDNTGRLSIS